MLRSMIAAALALACVAATTTAEAKREASADYAISCNNDGRCINSAPVNFRSLKASKRAARSETRGERGTAIAAPSFGGFGLVAAARAYMGTNPTGWRRVWCGRFMEMIAPAAAARVSNPHLARAWKELPRAAPHVGAIAILRGGRHVGVVSGFDDRGNPIVISGNHNRVVGEGVYPLRGAVFVSAS